MTSRRFRLPLSLLIVALLALTAAAPSSAAAPTAIAKKKKCKGDKVRVKINGKKRCRPLNKAMPAPQDIDPRLASVEGALGLKLKGVRDRRGRRVKPLKKKARKALLGAFPRALAGLDGLISEQARRQAHQSTGPPKATASAAPDCPDGPLPNGTYNQNSGGVSMQAGFNANGTAQVAIAFDQGGSTYRLKYETGAPCARNEVPRCPTAAGVVDSTDSRRDAITVEVLRGGEVVSSQRTTIVRQTKLHGQTADDAKLDYLDVDDIWKIDVDVGGAGSAPVSLRGTIKRSTRVNMRTGRYDPALTSANISGAPQLSRADDRGFAAAVNRAIFKYRVEENAWSSFDPRALGRDFCVQLKWNPEYNTMTLRKNQRGTFTGRVQAQDGGTATRSRWNAVQQTNVRVSPTSTRGGGTATFGIVPTAAGDNVATSVNFRVTSTAGVREGSYAVKTKDVPTINRIAGTFNSTYEVASGSFDSVLDFSGNVTYVRVTPAPFGGAMGSYNIESGGYTVTASGTDGTMASACQQTGSKHLNLPSGGSGGFFDVQGTPPEYLAPYGYSMVALAPGPQSMNVTLHDCPPGAEELEGETVTIGIGSAALDTRAPFGSQQSDDGIAYVGSSSWSQSGVSFDQSWSFHGEE
jgi:hypothetical protein